MVVELVQEAEIKTVNVVGVGREVIVLIETRTVIEIETETETEIGIEIAIEIAIEIVIEIAIGIVIEIAIGIVIVIGIELVSETALVSESEIRIETVIEIVIEIVIETEYRTGTGTVNANVKEIKGGEIVIENLIRVEVDTDLEVGVVSDHPRGVVVVAVGTAHGGEVGVEAGRKMNSARAEMEDKMARGPKRDLQKKLTAVLTTLKLKTRMVTVIIQMGPTMRK